MKKEVPTEIRQKYDLPANLTDFQLEMFIHLIEYKWKHITRDKGKFRGKSYGAILPESYQKEWYPIYQPFAGEIKNLKFKKHKHFGHMASSQAACLNLFYPILRDKSIADKVLASVKSDFKELAIGVLDNGFRFEYYDESNPLNDHTPIAGTDTDVAIAYYNTAGDLSLWLIEHKLTENEFTTCGGYKSCDKEAKNYCRNGHLILNDHSKCYYTIQCNYKYWEITDRSGLYDLVSQSNKKQCPFIGGENQLWRNQLLGYAVKEKGQFENIHFSVVHHPDNHDLDKTMQSYGRMLKDKKIFSSYTSMDFLRAASSINDQSIKSWITWYSEFYRI